MISIHKTKDGQFYSLVKAANGKTLYHSENVKQRRSALKTAVSACEVFRRLWDNKKGLEIRDFTK